jgi:hypothetical protein
MLYDKKWEQQASLVGFIAWLRTKNPNEEYEWGDPKNCACAQYFKTLPQGDNIWGTLISQQLDLLAIGLPRTFGALLERAEKVS